MVGVEREKCIPIVLGTAALPNAVSAKGTRGATLRTESASQPRGKLSGSQKNDALREIHRGGG